MTAIEQAILPKPAVGIFLILPTVSDSTQLAVIPPRRKSSFAVGDDGFTVRFFYANYKYPCVQPVVSSKQQAVVYKQNSQSLNDESLNKDDVSSCGTEVRELVKCIIGLKHNIEVIF